jgi:hypothetical protein
MTQEDLLEQLYGILDDWKAQNFGGDPIVEAIDNLRVMAATAPATSEELKKVTAALEKLANAVAAQQGPAGDSAPELKKIARTLERLAANVTAEDSTEREREEIADNVAEIASRMGRRLDTGSVRMTPTRPEASLDKANPIAPKTVFADGDASIYGVGLDAVREVRIDGSRAAIRRRTSREVEITVPARVGNGKVGVEVVLADGRVLQTSAKGVKS